MKIILCTSTCARIHSECINTYKCIPKKYEQRREKIVCSYSIQDITHIAGFFSGGTLTEKHMLRDVTKNHIINSILNYGLPNNHNNGNRVNLFIQSYRNNIINNYDDCCCCCCCYYS